MPRKKSAEKTLCGAQNRSGETCRQVAGMGTTHLGAGRCKYHGGATPTKHGVYSRMVAADEVEGYNAFMRDFDITHPTEGETFLLYRMLKYATGCLTEGATLEDQREAVRLGLEALRSLALVRARYAQVLHGKHFTVHFDSTFADQMMEAMADIICEFVPSDRQDEAANALCAIAQEKARAMDNAAAG